MSVDKGSWKHIAFSDIVVNVTEKVKPSDCNNACYIGLEHLSSDSIHVKTHGFSDDVAGEKIVIKKGDILFGKRRAYQRKVGIAPFDGIFSAHGMVLRPKTDVIIKEFLPFFIMSNYFMERAINKSVGSLSPTVNWNDLKKEYFKLPSIEEQKRIAEVLWAADADVESKEALCCSANDFYLSYLNEALFNSNGNSISFGEIADFNVETISEKKIGSDTVIDYIDISTIIEPKIIGEPTRYIFKEAPSRARRMAHHGDVLISTVRPNLKSFAMIENSDYVVSTGFAVATSRTELWRIILYHALFSSSFSAYCDNNVTGTSYPAISVEALKKFTLKIQHNLKLEYIANKLTTIENFMKQIHNNKLTSKCVLRNLIDYYLGGAN